MEVVLLPASYRSAFDNTGSDSGRADELFVPVCSGEKACVGASAQPSATVHGIDDNAVGIRQNDVSEISLGF
jgi:hypothetical protein